MRWSGIARGAPRPDFRTTKGRSPPRNAAGHSLPDEAAPHAKERPERLRATSPVCAGRPRRSSSSLASLLAHHCGPRCSRPPTRRPLRRHGTVNRPPVPASLRTRRHSFGHRDMRPPAAQPLPPRRGRRVARPQAPSRLRLFSDTRAGAGPQRWHEIASHLAALDMLGSGCPRGAQQPPGGLQIVLCHRAIHAPHRPAPDRLPAR